ncbi:MAG TPA: hypothetical protein VKE94_16360, partial [Gemmataceae bacterium]|nr:hypothetical protein [Gemmataceae bacterium]
MKDRLARRVIFDRRPTLRASRHLLPHTLKACFALCPLWLDVSRAFRGLSTEEPLRPRRSLRFYFYARIRLIRGSFVPIAR